jgi:glucokinase
MRHLRRLALTIVGLDNAGISTSSAHPASDIPYVGVDIGGSKVLAVRLSAAGEVEAVDRLPTPRSAPEIVEAVLSVAARVLPDDGPGLGPPLGVGCPGMVDSQGVPQFCPHLHCVDGVDLRSELAGRRPEGATTIVSNDATAACWAEHSLGAARGHDHVLMVTLGTGIGGGYVMNGQLVGGAHGFAGEIGHMVVDPYGPPCPCGKRGCWERFASGNGLGTLAREAAQAGRLRAVVRLAGGDPEAVRGEHVTAAALEGEREALEVMNTFAWWLALGLANLANAVDPSVIVLGGGLIEAESVVMGPVRRAFAELAEAPGARSVEIAPAHFGERAGAVGAGLLAAEIAAGPPVSRGPVIT